MELVLGSHGASSKQDDHFGKMASGVLVSFIRRPANISTDVALVKSSMAKYQKEGITTGLTTEELQTLRWHGAKATLSSVMQRLGIREKTVRFQGSWASRAEAMPDTYLREAQTLVLAAQLKCLEYLRSGGEVYRLEGIPVGTAGESTESTDARGPDEAEDVARKEKAMAVASFEGQDPSDVAPALLDDGFDEEGSLSQSVLDKEKSIFKDGDNWEECLKDAADDDADDDVASPSPFLEGEIKVKAEGVDPQDVLDEEDSEGLITHWVQAKVTHGVAKDLPANDELVEGVMVDATPKCGISGNFELAKVEDPLDPTTLLCRRCVPRSSEGACEGICSHMHLGRKNLAVQRCYRRCQIEGAHEDHKCPLHFKEA